MKYGALRCADGAVEIDWTIEASSAAADRRFRLGWREVGGPRPSPSQGEGFGSRLMRGLAHELGGVATVDYASSGARWEIEARLPAGVSEALLFPDLEDR